MPIIKFECKKCKEIFDCETGKITFGNILDFEKDIICPNCGKLTKEEILLTEYGQTQIGQLYFKDEPVIKGYGIYEGLISNDNKSLKKDLKDFINKDTRELCEYFGFDYYLEVKNNFIFRSRQNHEDIINALYEFIGNRPVKVIKAYNDQIKKYFDMDLEETKKNAMLFGKNKGKFYFEDPSICFCLLGDNFFTYILCEMLFFYGKKEGVDKMAYLFDKYSVDYHKPYKLDKYEPYDFENNIDEDDEDLDEEDKNEETDNEIETRPKKIGRNDPCPCGSGKKYKKCCLKL